ncbi:hypothetical protein GDO78_017703, partial [Eleutherodactylus coqui]
GLRCSCPAGFAVEDLGSPQVNCSQCQPHEVVSVDRRTCLRCDGGRCSCSSGEAREENLVDKTSRCVVCGGGTRPSAAGDRCELCPPTYGSNCSCPANQQSGGLCLPVPKQDLAPVTLWESLYLYPSYVVCRDYNNATACQVLANMVIMNVFSSSSKAYELYSAIRPPGVFLPPVIYSPVTPLGSTAPANLSYQKNARIHFWLARYDVRGKFLDWEVLKGGTLQLCQSSQDILDAAFTFGTFYNLS